MIIIKRHIFVITPS